MTGATPPTSSSTASPAASTGSGPASISSVAASSVGGHCCHLLLVLGGFVQGRYHRGRGGVGFPHAVGFVEDGVEGRSGEVHICDLVPYYLREGPPPDSEHYIGAMTVLER